MILLYTGNGKGKTSASIGAIIRSLAYNRKVLFAQFLKLESSESRVLKNLGVDYVFFGKDKWITKQNKNEFLDLVLDGIKTVKEMHQKNQYDLIVLDELNIVIYMELLKSEDAIAFIKELLEIKECDVIITGRYATKELIAFADLVTEMKEIKHPFEKGIIAKEGIDY